MEGAVFGKFSYSLILVILSLSIDPLINERNLVVVHRYELECPTIIVSCRDDVSPKVLTYTAHISGLESGQKVSYKWSVSRGKIKSGQGTSSITIERPEEMYGLTATVEVEGLPKGCGNAASCTTVF
jgi:hypothetical protein